MSLTLYKGKLWLDYLVELDNELRRGVCGTCEGSRLQP